MIADRSIVDEYISELYANHAMESQPILRILLMNTLLLMNADLNKYELLIKKCMYDISEERYKENTAFYSGNIKTDTQPNTCLPNTYFGSPAITCSLYIEFLNLYRKRFYGSYYGQD